MLDGWYLQSPFLVFKIYSSLAPDLESLISVILYLREERSKELTDVDLSTEF